MMKRPSLILLFLLSAVSYAQADAKRLQNGTAQEWAPVELNKKITHPQPMTGLVLWPAEAESRNSTHGGSITLEYSYCLPCLVVKGCNSNGSIQYDWTWFDNLLNDVASRGHQLVARFRYEYPNGDDIPGAKKGATAVPQYIKDRSDYHETHADNPGGDGPTDYADWSNAELQRFTKVFYTDFAERYKNDKRLAFVEVGFGHWSEYHIYGTPLKLGVNFPTKEYQAEFLKYASTALKDIPWAISIDASDEEYTPIVGSSELMALNFGLFDDSFMHQNHEIGTKDGYNEECWNAIGAGTRWQTGVCGGEISYYKGSDQKNFLNPAGMYGHTWEEQAKKYHITFMIANDAPSGSYGTGARFKEATMASGYRICVKSCETNGTATRLTVTNNGVAPLYRDAFFAIGDVRSTTSLKGLLPGQELTIEIAANLSNANDLKIACDCILDTQEIEFEAGEGSGGSGEGGEGGEGGDNPTPTPTPTDDATICYFTGTNPSSNQVQLASSNYSTSKGAVTYGGKEYKNCIKMESKTEITITPTHSGTVTLIYGGSTSPANQSVVLNGQKVTLDANGQYSFEATAGTTYTLKKDQVQIFLFLILLPDGSTTGIRGINLIDNGQLTIHNSQFTIHNDAPMFNLAGQRVGKGYKGIVIQNGKKRVMK